MEYRKYITRILQFLIIIGQITSFSQTTHIHPTKSKLKNDITENPQTTELSTIRRDFHIIRHEYGTKISGKSRRWSHRRRLGATFSPWTAWTHCDHYCKQKRERYCSIRRKCGEAKHIEERRCPAHACNPLPHSLYSSQSYTPDSIFSHSEHIGSKVRNIYVDDEDASEEKDYFVIRKRPKKRPKNKKVIIKVEDYEDDDDNFDDDESIFLDNKKRSRVSKKNVVRHFIGRKNDRKLYTKKSFDWDRNYPYEEDTDDDEQKNTDDIDGEPEDFDEETTLFQDNEEDNEQTSSSSVVRKKTVRGYQIPNKYSLNSDNAPTLDRNYGSIFETTTPSFFHLNNRKFVPGTFFNTEYTDKNSNWASVNPSFNVNHNQNTNQNFNGNEDHLNNRRWDEPTKRMHFNSEIGTDFSDDLFNRSADFLRRMNNFTNRIENRNNGKEKAVFDMPSRFRRVYSKWSKWSKCSAKCTTRRFKRCKAKDICGNAVVREVAYCYTEGSFCQTWINGQVKKNSIDQKPINMPQSNAIRPYKEPYQNRRETNAINNEYFPHGRSYKSPEYAPQNFKCGLPSVRNKPKHYLWGMLRIIGGKSARKGQWPWQVAILNRFKEAFCGGTLISPLWVLTAAHCVRKKLYARLGEHNLELDDGSEIEYKIESSIKHPKYDKRTVDNDVAMLRLPKEVATSMFIGFACLPHSYQQLPKTHQCTIIGWGKKRNTDDAGTNVLHEAEVPIISNEDCKKVYYDYTITKNMFCAGHKRGRIDTCAGDSGGPLLCRDTTVPNQPWTIFGITSFGDGCGKRNKFGIYAKLPNYVDWIWSVVNCNGNCNSMPIL